jgi:aldehyde dehydrogenase (NAD+)
MTTHAAANTTDTSALVASDIQNTVERLRKTFASGRTRGLEWRRRQLRAIEKMMAENEAKIAEALQADLCRKPFEAWLADTATTAAEARYAAKHVKKWMRRKHHLLELAQMPAAAGWSTSPTAPC